MSYAIETKKRKFDRILEALADATGTSPSRTSLNSRNCQSTSLTGDDASDGSKRRRIAPTSRSNLTATNSTASLVGLYLPASRTAFLERLETFRHVTQWHVPSTDSINAAAWAKRGWTCVDTDTVSCGSCRARVHIDLSLDSQLLKTRESEQQGEVGPEQQEDDFEVAAEVYHGIIARYQDQIIAAHSESCLWRKRGSDASIQRIEGLLNTNTALSATRKRYEGIMIRPEQIPNVAALPSACIAGERELLSFRPDSVDEVNTNALKLAICGWERKSDDVIECRNCFRSLGLWLYRGAPPAIEKLDGVDNHLEYCPWRSAEAQDTEIALPKQKHGEDSAPAKARVPGWELVHMAIVRDNTRKLVHESTLTSTASEAETSTGSSDSMITPEQREKKMRDLLKRIKEIKKPFNVKSLLRRKEKGKA
ncbi:uncharacterized protein A1O9_01277 [Exophiala aquamarina CBS 119918]|uniref:C3HC-type domain-containing protein n=1 Tax=Exophiala aquamarina CBS 119918 TaxID=1182545 RepID=A0A072Q5X5_9EURO|nr:uncharacterized protein A1O9_01277 [Exophiala aquamarina CBS 119918]KEF63300.1 hypothetical protein A1O9_01277 [Exophiala aquamarina CBS 119918]